jgi:hypothetical protein
MKVAIEYEGIYSGKSRHTSMKGYTMDACKYNIAAANGWRVFRYTSGNYMDIVTDLQKLGITIKEV